MAARTTLLGIEFSFRKAVPTEVNYLVKANFPLPRGHLLVANVPMFAAIRFATCVSPVCPKFGQFFSFSSDAWLFMITISHFPCFKVFHNFQGFFPSFKRFESSDEIFNSRTIKLVEASFNLLFLRFSGKYTDASHEIQTLSAVPASFSSKYE